MQLEAAAHGSGQLPSGLWWAEEPVLAALIRYSTHPRTACPPSLALAVHTGWTPTGHPALSSSACLPLDASLSPCSARLRSGRRHRSVMRSGSSPKPPHTRLRLSPVSDGGHGGPTASEHFACTAVVRVPPLLSLACWGDPILPYLRCPSATADPLLVYGPR